jgi:hypothetical protein
MGVWDRILWCIPYAMGHERVNYQVFDIILAETVHQSFNSLLSAEVLLIFILQPSSFTQCSTCTKLTEERETKNEAEVRDIDSVALKHKEQYK